MIDRVLFREEALLSREDLALAAAGLLIVTLVTGLAAGTGDG